jgi:hypothetical protein
LVGKAVLLFVGAYAVLLLAVLALIRLPDIAMFRYVVFIIPALAASVAVAYWLELGAPWPAVSPRPSRQHLDRRHVAGARSLVTRAG